jgi:benzil reductase ((S)-benzoin forming)
MTMKVIITGTSSGLGYGLTMHYLEEGHHVYGISRKANDELVKYNNFSFLSHDIANFESLKEAIPVFLKGLQSIDLVILNAGILNDIKDLRNTSIDEIRQVMDVNVWANKILLDSFFETLDQVKQVVAISSGAAVSGTRGWNAYSLSKATLNMLIDLYSKEYKHCHFCALAPGLIETGMQDYINDLPEEYEKKFPMVKKLKQARGTESMPKPSDAAKIISSAISKLVKYESGSFIDVRDLD